MSIIGIIKVMKRLTDAQVIEVFHLQFLQVLSTRPSDWFALKGGANLRYFFQSVRYSNDIDLDWWGASGNQVRRNVDRVLEGTALPRLLSISGIVVVERTSPKQTDTTRRWKLGLRRATDSDDRALIRTKIEFSGRGGVAGEVVAESIPRDVVEPYGMAPAVLNHYTAAPALEQKIAALALCNETRARDVFDLDLLLRHGVGGLGREIDGQHAERAASTCLEVSFDSFRTEVLAFLDPDVAEIYDSTSRWELMRDGVAERLLELASRSGDEL